jgi:hypothetical protein
MSYPENDTVAVALALAHIRQTIPGGPNDLAVAAFTKLAAIGDQAALAEVEDWLESHSLSIPYGDRDDDPTGWDLDPAALVALARWWEQLGLAAARSERLAAYALGEGWPLGPGSWQIYRTAAPHLADQVAPRLLAALPGADARRRKDIASGLGSTPTPAAIDTLIALLDDPDRTVRGEARFALQWVWQQRYSTAEQKQATVNTLIGALAAPSPAIRLGALQALPWP